MTIVVTVDYYRYRNELKNKDIENGVAKLLNDSFPNINHWEYDKTYRLPNSLEEFILAILFSIIEKKNKIYSSSFMYISNNFCLILKEVNDG